jgi:mannose-6-phosphate isomerase-like protein (cupin superfamily)
MKIEKVNLKDKFGTFQDHWKPKIVGELNQQQVKLAKFKGEFVMHHHANEDEFFLVVKGQLFIELTDQTLEINEGEFVIIPRGVEHKPFAPEEVSVMLFEPSTTLNTGNQKNDFTITDLDNI